MPEALAQKKFSCPACGAAAEWNPAKQSLTCRFCNPTWHKHSSYRSFVWADNPKRDLCKSPSCRRSAEHCSASLLVFLRGAMLRAPQVATFAEISEGIASSSPGLRGTSYPGSSFSKGRQPQRGCGDLISLFPKTPQPRLGLCDLARSSQGSACRTTLGFGTESRWDSSSVRIELPGV